MSVTRYHSTWDNMRDYLSIHEHQADTEVSKKYRFPQTRNIETLHIKNKIQMSRSQFVPKPP
jgi:hypothetical protein